MARSRPSSRAARSGWLLARAALVEESATIADLRGGPGQLLRGRQKWGDWHTVSMYHKNAR
eukprot:4427461-Pyramimonas_sp.AAC.1